MITKQKCLFFFVGDKPFKTLAEAQKHDLVEIIASSAIPQIDVNADVVADFMLKHATALVDILTTTPTSRARARKNNGATKAKKPKLQPANIDKEVTVKK